MSILLGVTGKTIRRSPIVFAVDMTGSARNTLMIAHQRKSRLVVIKTHILPIGCIMATRAIVPHLSAMKIHVTGSTGSRRTFKDKVLMATRTLHRDVFARKWKRGF